MAEKTYQCLRWPAYSIKNLYFQNGYYTTSDSAEQELIEGCDVYGIHIIEVVVGEQVARDSRPRRLRKPGVRQGMVSSATLRESDRIDDEGEKNAENSG